LQKILSWVKSGCFGLQNLPVSEINHIFALENTEQNMRPKRRIPALEEMPVSFVLSLFGK